MPSGQIRRSDFDIELDVRFGTAKFVLSDAVGLAIDAQFLTP